MRILFILFALLMAGDAFARLPDLIPYRKGNFWGYCDSTKRIVIEPQWEYTSPFRGATAVVKKNGLYGLIDRTGKATTAYIYNSLEEDSRNGKRIATSGKKRKNTGLIDEHGKEIIPFQYSRIYWESDKYLRVHDGGINGEMDTTGKIIVPFDYVTTRPEQGFDFGQSAACGYFVFSKWSGAKFGVIDSTGKVVIPLDYSMVFDMGNGYFFMVKYFRIDRHQGIDSEYVFDRTGKRITWQDVPPPHYPCRVVPASMADSAHNLYYEGWNDCNIPGNRLHSQKLLYAGFFHAGRASFMTYDSLCGYVDENFNVIIPTVYGWCSDFSPDSIALICKPHHHYPEKRKREAIRYDRFDVEHRQPHGYIDIHGTEYWED